MAPVAGLHRVVDLVPVTDECAFQGLVQGGLVALDRQEVVRPHAADGARDLALGAHRIDTDQAAFDRQGFEQRRDGGVE